MSRTTYTNLISALKTKISNLAYTSGDKIFSEVFDYGEGNFTKYPVAVIKEIAGEGSFADNARNERVFEFSITLFQEISDTGKSKEEAAQIMRGCVDEVIEAFDTDLTLSGSAIKIEVVPVSIDVSIRQGVFSFAEFRIKVVNLVNNF